MGAGTSPGRSAVQGRHCMGGRNKSGHDVVGGPSFDTQLRRYSG